LQGAARAPGRMGTSQEFFPGLLNAHRQNLYIKLRKKRICFTAVFRCYTADEGR